jgi:uncharacterized protein (DUF3820 family)
MARSNWVKNQYGEIKIGFGKHRGEYLHNLPNSYLEWMVKKYADGEGFEDDEELIVEVESELKVREKSGHVIEA